MPPISAQTRIYLARNSTNMRMSFKGLITLTEGILQQDPASGHLFVFLNRRRDMIKVLYWDGSGFCIWYKRLERGSFEIPVVEAAEGTGENRTPAETIRKGRSKPPAPRS